MAFNAIVFIVQDKTLNELFTLLGIYNLSMCITNTNLLESVKLTNVENLMQTKP